MRAWIFGAMQAKAEDALFYKRFKFGEKDLLICADGGYNNAAAIGITPHIIIGDMDSVKGSIASSVEKIVHPRMKDKTDLHLCIDYALEKGCDEIILLFAFGGRIDHSLASIASLRYILENGAKGMLITRHSSVFLTQDKTRIKRGMYSRISLIPLTGTAEGVTTKGLQYPLENKTLLQSENLGISNAFCSDEAEVNLTRGILCIICEEGE